MLTDRPLTALLDAFSSTDPTPGGGSASALAGALGASLLVMVAGLSKTRHQSDEDRHALAEAGAALRGLRDRLVALVDRDAEAYERVVAAYRRPKGTEDERRARAQAIQQALVQAIGAPLDVMRASREALDRAGVVAARGNPSAASDVEVGVELLGAALRGARLNVEINLGGVSDRAYADRVSHEVRQLVEAAEALGGRARTSLRDDV